MATLRNRRKVAALNKENCEELPTCSLAQNSNVPRSQEDYITQVSEEIEGRVTKRLSKEFSRTESRILGALARLNDLLMNPLLQGHSGTTPEMSRNAFITNQGTNEDDSQSDPHAEAGIFGNQTTRNSGQEDQRDRQVSCKNNLKVELMIFLPNMTYERKIINRDPQILSRGCGSSDTQQRVWGELDLI